jgi:hypothetical protein
MAKKIHAKKDSATKVILMKDAETDDEEDEDESGIYLDKASVQIIYNALSQYTPTPDEENVYGVLHEEFEEMLVVGKRSRGKPVENQRLNFLAFAHRLY